MEFAARPGVEEHFQKCHWQLFQFSSWPSIDSNEKKKEGGVLVRKV